jgi:NADPH:quinone reductase-like Zn-dependent oxidoreductase
MPEHALVVLAPGRPALVELEEATVPEGGFAVRTLYSGISAGTELTWVKGTNPFLAARWDAEAGVFRHGEPGAGYPVAHVGYMEVGRVEESRSAAVSDGALVGMAYGHRTRHVADPRRTRERVVPLPGDLDPVLGIYAAHMGPICANGLLHAAAELAGPAVEDLGAGVRGRHVLVTGAGVIGLLCGLLSLHHGAAAVAVADATPARLGVAAALGMWAIDERAGPAWEAIKAAWRHGPADRGADVVLQCRGRDEALAGALRCLRPQGTVIDLAFYPGGAPGLRLGEEFHHNGLAIRCAQIGRVPRGLAGRWDRDRLSAETVALLRARGGAIREHLITDVVSFERGPELLRALARRERHSIQAVLAGATNGASLPAPTG